ncbi:MAG: glycoside hydrolase family 9 protein [Woeseiaceae bacterium]
MRPHKPRPGSATNALAAAIVLGAWSAVAVADLRLNERGYFESPGLDVIVFSDIYPEGHQTGVTVVQHGVRVAANGDLRLEASPGQWSPVPRAVERRVDEKEQTLTPATGNAFRITVDLDKPLPEDWVGRVGFNFELFPGDLFGKGWLLDDAAGHFPVQPNGPVVEAAGEFITLPLASGRKLVVAPGHDRQRLRIESLNGDLELLDGRANHNNGWYIVRSLVPAGATRGAVEWVVTPNVVPGWQYAPVVQVSQLGYATSQPKRVVIEQDRHDRSQGTARLLKLTPDGPREILSGQPDHWAGDFLRYHYLTWDFSNVTEPGLYVIDYRGVRSHAFRIGDDVYARHAWQPVLEYYLPVQMCHMRVNEKYRVWHGLDHLDDARMAPVDLNHFDGYSQGPSTLTKYAPLDPVPGLDRGGWHDAGDYDLRVESQIGTIWLLAQAIEEFGIDFDTTRIDQDQRLVEIHEPDGVPDAHQQIEHGLLSVLGAYDALGRLYRGIIVPTKRQYVLLGDGSVQTDNRRGNDDDRWVFTEQNPDEQNPDRELYVAAGLAAAGRVLRDYDKNLAAHSIEVAARLYADAYSGAERDAMRVFAAAELAQATREDRYLDDLLKLRDAVTGSIGETGWALAKAMPLIDDREFVEAVAAAVETFQQDLARRASETPYGVPYRPHIWGAGWGIQEFGVRQYFFNKAWPDASPPDFYLDALNFVLGVHPGENTMSFASGVGANSALVAYGVNRADWSFIPGGVISGTALIRPDLPELKIWPFFWNQTEYVMGGGSTNYRFLVLAADRLFNAGPER